MMDIQVSVTIISPCLSLGHRVGAGCWLPGTAARCVASLEHYLASAMRSFFARRNSLARHLASIHRRVCPQSMCEDSMVGSALPATGQAGIRRPASSTGCRDGAHPPFCEFQRNSVADPLIVAQHESGDGSHCSNRS